jgi:hypothetical protein
MTKSLARLGRLSICAVAMLAGCDKTPESPTAVTGATLQSLTISGLPSEFSVGDRTQMSARGGWSDGRSEDVTGRVRWTSRSVACLVTSSGAVTANEPGDCSIDASFESRSTTGSVRVTPARSFVISGVVREKFELREPPIPNATITIASGQQNGRATTSDSAGRYVFDNVPREPVTLRIEAPDLETLTIQASPDSPHVDAFLPPQMVTLTWDSRTGGIAPPGAERFTVPFQTHRRGYITLSVYSSRYECGTYETFGGDVTLENGSTSWYLGISPCSSHRTGVPELKSDARGPDRYVLRMFRLFAGTWLDRINIVSVTHPR